MTKRKLFRQGLLILAASFFVLTARAAFENDIAVPSHLYLITETRNDLFVKPFLKRWRPYTSFVRFSLDRREAKFMRRLSHVATIDRPVDGSTLTVELVDGDEFETVKTLRSVIRVGKKGVGTRPVSAQIVGDSFTESWFYRAALCDTNIVPNLRLVGLREQPGGWRDEGRGGWWLGAYFMAPVFNHKTFYHGFMHPVGEGLRYWGMRDFWRLAWQCRRGTQEPGFEPLYSCGRYGDRTDRFDEKTGTLLNPVQGDVQGDCDRKILFEYDGVAWVEKPADAYTWEFNYSKYLEMWNLGAPDFLFVMLGLNDFGSSLTFDFTEWGERITRFKDSYRKAKPNGRFVIAIPCSTCGTSDNTGGLFTEKYNASMWRFRKWLIDTFDRREAEGFYVLDAGITIDNDNGYELVAPDAPVAQPFAGAPEDARPLAVQTGNPHCCPNYPALGNPFAAFIQYWRDKE